MGGYRVYRFIWRVGKMPPPKRPVWWNDTGSIPRNHHDQ